MVTIRGGGELLLFTELLWQHLKPIMSIDAYQQEIITLQDLSTRREQITQRLKGQPFQHVCSGCHAQS